MAHAQGDGNSGFAHPAPLRMLMLTFFMLAFLTWLTVAVVNVDLGDANIYIALGIAVVKSTFVALYFMHLRWGRPVNGIIFVGSIAAIALFLAITMADSGEYRVLQEQYRETKNIQAQGSPWGDSEGVQAAILERAAAAEPAAAASGDGGS
jgi:cytochrome c oxidase subunit 4